MKINLIKVNHAGKLAKMIEQLAASTKVIYFISPFRQPFQPQMSVIDLFRLLQCKRVKTKQLNHIDLYFRNTLRRIHLITHGGITLL